MIKDHKFRMGGPRKADLASPRGVAADVRGEDNLGIRALRRAKGAEEAVSSVWNWSRSQIHLDSIQYESFSQQLPSLPPIPV